MPRILDLENGIIISTGATTYRSEITISCDSEFWEFPDDKKTDLIEKARITAIYLSDIEILAVGVTGRDRFEMNRIDWDDIPDDVQNRMNSNPFIRDWERRLLWCDRQNYQRRQKDGSCLRSASQDTRKEVIKRDGLRCRYCGKELKECEIQIDHVIPFSKGGKTTIDNLVVSCQPCNRKKFNKNPEQARMLLLEV